MFELLKLLMAGKQVQGTAIEGRNISIIHL